ncbi:PhzF family phenazine biosynthesis protein [Streptomyces sp. TRM 70351]|uniref:PhzF family phenazine biosynthesis protein n=1 Tax=Streptomyces sp. TRM 70351 TaxID=3116552 RepID=UPI002E7C1C12|nr:PhzF family phenazine biosynthesis protein [Streptomyces sp. TRM 70351]MEE1931342.1 PhzF family phenazine biosynthesis protein [Streptomyces sp. TRM 70351]
MRFRIVDAFTERPFAGNPAAVVLFDAGPFPDDARLQRLAAELYLSETAYAHPLPPGAGADWALRWFTPVAEVRLCGHATLATAHVLAATGRARGTVRFATLSGVLSATAGEDGTVTLDFPTAPLTPVEAPAAVAGALGTTVRTVHETGPQVLDLLVEVADEAAVRALRPDLRALAALDGRGVIVTAGAEETGGGYDYVSRCFFPALGIDEDPVTGSAHTALAPLWSARLGRETLTGLQASARTGLVRTTLRGERTLLTGHAVTVVDGTLLTGW